MDIEIVTTKRKLTKGIVSQMRSPGLKELQNCEVLGYLVNVVKDMYKAVLLKSGSDYYVISMAWSKGDLGLYRKVGKWSHSMKFETVEACEEFWRIYKAVISKAETQIYL